VFIRVYRLEIVNFLRTFSHVGFFNPALWSVLSPVAPFPFSQVQPPPPPLIPCLNKYTLYTYTVCKGGHRVLGLRQINTCRKVHLHVNFFDDDILHCLPRVLSFYVVYLTENRLSRLQANEYKYFRNCVFLYPWFLTM
jgi:hypothetical protein